MDKLAQLRIDKDTWPPGQSDKFTSLLLVHDKGQQRMDQAVEVAKLVHKGDITSLTTEQLVHTKLDDHAMCISKVIKEVIEILASLEEREEPQFIIIEGTPNIGKSVLLNEIACRWGRQQMLQTFTLLLLVCLHSPIFQQAKSIGDLLFHNQFWSNMNMFFIYITLTKGQRSTFKEFLSGGKKNSYFQWIPMWPTESLQLFYCFYGAQDYQMCIFIEEVEIFHEKEIDLNAISCWC